MGYFPDRTKEIGFEKGLENHADLDGRSMVLWIWGFLALGCLLRIVAYLYNFPLWWDEAFMAVNLLRRDYADLLRPLDYGQVCPVLFLWLELLIVRVVGFHEWSLRLLPLLCSLGSVFLFRFAASRALDLRAQVIAVGVFSVSLHPIRHAADVKPYSCDLLTALTLQTMAIAWFCRRNHVRWLWALTIFIPFALLSSYPSIFVIGGIGIVLGTSWLIKPTWRVGAAVVAYGLTGIFIYVVMVLPYVHSQSSAAAAGMTAMWFRSFPPLDNFLEFVRWVVTAHSGDMLAYPVGGEKGLSSLNLAVGLIGIMVLAQRRDWGILGILIAPLGLAMIAAALRLYPYGGPAPHGSAARIMQYAAPSLCLLIGLGGSCLLDRVATEARRLRLYRLICLGLILVGVVPQIASFSHPYRAYHAEVSRRFARGFWKSHSQGVELADLRWDLKVAEWDSIHLGTAVFLCNEAIQLPGRMVGGPRLDRVTANRPLRCVLGDAPEIDSSQILHWLSEMSRIYHLRKREMIRLRITEAGRPPDYERYEIFEFVPRIPVARSEN